MRPSIFPSCFVAALTLAPACDLGPLEGPKSYATDPGNCGESGHDCGGGACEKGACQETVVQSGIVGLGGFAVDASGVYYTSNVGDFDARLLRCPASGCALQPDQLASGLRAGAAVQLGPDDVFFGAAPIQSTIRNHVYTCPKAGCSAPPVSLFNAGLMGGADDQIVAVGNRWFTSFGDGLITCQFERGKPCGPRAVPAAEVPYRSHGSFPLAADATSVYFGHAPPALGDTPPRHDLVACEYESDCSAPTLLAEDLTPDALAAHDGTVYILRKGGTGGVPSGAVLSCPASGCGLDGPVALIRKLACPTALAVDASGVYWYAADAGTIAMCPLAGCGGGARTLVSDLKGVNRLALSGGFIYWSARDPAGGEGAPSTIYRLAK